MAAFVDFAGARTILSHGRDDLVIGEDCALKELDNLFSNADWRDINPPIHAVTGQRLMSSELLAFFDLDPVGPVHDALARVMAHFKNENRF